MSLEELLAKVKAFNAARGWEQYHNPRNLAMSLSIESSELMELYHWLSDDDCAAFHSEPKNMEKLCSEVGDIMIYLSALAIATNIDLVKCAEEKLCANEKRYPLDKMKGQHSNPVTGYKARDHQDGKEE